VLILHGEDDTNVPVGQAMYFQRALTQFSAEHEPAPGNSFDNMRTTWFTSR
jgi:dipeptidyl aminopeptidase/acylaminoacyl peptidase